MADEVTYFPVGNADMTLLKLRDGTVVLIDCYLQEAATDTSPTVAKDLIDQLPKDAKKRPYVDIFILTHPDEDHCKGAKQYMHLGSPSDYDDQSADKKIFIRQMWSSPLIFRRQSKSHKLCDDAQALNTEAKRRVQKYRDSTATSISGMAEGEQIRLIGSDWKRDDGSNRLADLDGIRTQVKGKISWSDDAGSPLVEVYVHGPLDPSEGESFASNEETLSKNGSSIILRWKVFAKAPNSFQYNALLFGGDAEVDIWDRLWRENIKDPEPLEYDVLLAPHHCSWGVLSSGDATDSSSEVNPNARKALSQKRQGAKIFSSSKPIKNDKDNPPADRAKREYKSIVSGDANFKCLGEYPKEAKPEPLKLTLSKDGTKIESKALAGSAAIITTPTRAG